MSESDGAADGEVSGVSPEEQARIDAIKRRNLALAAIAGIIMMILGFFAGQAARERKSGALDEFPSAIVFEVFGTDVASSPVMPGNVGAASL